MAFTCSAARPSFLRAAGVLVAIGALLAPAVASAETRVRARYSIQLAGFDIGKATMQTGIDRAAYSTNLSIQMTGLAKFFTNGRGAATARGQVQDAKVVPTAYAINTRSGSKGRVIRIALAGGTVSQLMIDPPPSPQRRIVPVTDADTRGIVDPLSAVIMPVAGSGEALSPASCDRKLPVFDGRQRYDVTLRYDRMETAKPDRSENADPKAGGGYDGALVVCKASYRAIAGHRPDRENVTFMENNKDMEVWLAPVTGSRVLMPWKIAVRTEMGMAVITATSFVVNGARRADSDL